VSPGARTLDRSVDRPPSRQILPGLTGLRGIGAAWVVLFHVTYPLQPPVLRAGYLGVDLFFLLSGFVLSHAHGVRGEIRDVRTYRRFLGLRLARIYPLHLFALLLVALAVLEWPGFATSFGPGPERFGLRSFIASVLLVQNLGIGMPTGWNTPAWTLSAEWFASLLFPVFLLAARPLRSTRAALAATWVALLVFAAFLGLTHHRTPDVAGPPGMVRMACEFAAGCMLHRAYAAGAAAAGRMAWMAAAAIAIGVLGPGTDTLAVFGFPVVVLLAARENAVSRSLCRPTVQFLGKISYSIYLLHWIILQAAIRWADVLGIGGWGYAAWLTAAVVIVLAASALSYRCIEVPARNMLRNRIVLRPRRGA
jgi:peptidoglycan/LPS O-acetylase OafA/YrhL